MRVVALVVSYSTCAMAIVIPRSRFLGALSTPDSKADEVGELFSKTHFVFAAVQRWCLAVVDDDHSPDVGVGVW